MWKSLENQELTRKVPGSVRLRQEDFGAIPNDVPLSEKQPFHKRPIPRTTALRQRTKPLAR